MQNNDFSNKSDSEIDSEEYSTLTFEQINYFTDMFFNFSFESNSYIILETLLLAEIMGTPEGLETIRLTWKMQGEDIYHYFMGQMEYLYNEGDQETRYYLIFILSQFIKGKIFRNESQQRRNLDDNIDFGLSELIISFLDQTTSIEDSINILRCIDDLDNPIFDLKSIYEILLVFEKKASDHIKYFEPMHLYKKLYKEFYYYFQGAIYHLNYKTDAYTIRYEINEYEEGLDFKVRVKLQACIIFLFHLNVFKPKVLLRNLSLIFDNLNSRNLKIRQEPFYKSIIQLYPLTTDFLEKFHYMTLKFPSDVFKNLML